MRKILGIIVCLAISLAGFWSFSEPTFAGNVGSSSVCDDGNGIPDDLKKQAGCDEKKTAPSVAVSIMNVVVGLIGLTAIVVVVIGGLSITTSNGDPSKVKKGKDMILYGIIGVVVASIAFAIVNLVISRIL